MQRSTVLCLAAACLFSMLLWQASAYTPSKDYRSGQLSPSVLLMGEFDWTLSTGRDGKPWSRCLDMVWRARAVSNGNKLNFVPTHHWIPNSNGLGVASYCYMHTSGAVGDKGSCLPWTPEKLAEFKKSMTLCFTEAFKQGFVPYVRPHLDDGLNRYGSVLASERARSAHLQHVRQGTRSLRVAGTLLVPAQLSHMAACPAQAACAQPAQSCMQAVQPTCLSHSLAAQILQVLQILHPSTQE
mgnify:CR=1 FL=1